MKAFHLTSCCLDIGIGKCISAESELIGGNWLWRVVCAEGEESWSNPECLNEWELETLLAQWKKSAIKISLKIRVNTSIAQ